MGDVEGSHHGDPFGDVAVRLLGDFAHPVVDVGDGVLQSVTFLGRAGDPVFLAEQGDVET